MISEIVSSCMAKLEEVQASGFLNGLKEHFSDAILEEHDLDDPDAFELIFSKYRPSPESLTADMKIGRIEIQVPNPFGRDLTQDEMDAVTAELPRHTKAIWSYDKEVLLQSSLLKRTKAWYKPRPGYKGPVEADPTEVVSELSNGYSVMLLKTDDEIRTEGRKLNHCVGRRDMEYLDAVRSGKSILYSVREPDGSACLTIEQDAESRNIVQVSGKKNRGVGRKSFNDHSFTRPEEVRALVEWLAGTEDDEQYLGSLKKLLGTKK